MSDDLLKRLRLDWAPIFGACFGTMLNAADRIAELEAALEDMSKHVWRGDWDKLKPETKKVLGEQK